VSGPKLLADATTNKIQFGRRGLEELVQHGRVLRGSNLFAQPGVEESQALEGDATAGAADDIIGFKFGRSVVPREREVNLAARDRDIPQLNSEMCGDVL
jgi:hypothetical protein